MNMNLTIGTVMEMFVKEEAFARSKIHSLALGTLTIDHPTRKKKQIERTNKLSGILAKWVTVMFRFTSKWLPHTTTTTTMRVSLQASSGWTSCWSHPCSRWSNNY